MLEGNEHTVKWCLEYHGCFNATRADDLEFIERCKESSRDGPKSFACRWVARYLNIHCKVEKSRVEVNGDCWKRRFLWEWYKEQAKAVNIKAIGLEAFKVVLSDIFSFAYFLPWDEEEDWPAPKHERKVSAPFIPVDV